MSVHVLDCVHRPTSRAIAIRIVLEVSLEDRLQHDLGSGLNHAIPDSWNAERTLASSILRDHYPPHRIRPICLREQFLAQASEPRSSICSKLTPSTPGAPALARASPYA